MNPGNLAFLGKIALMSMWETQKTRYLLQIQTGLTMGYTFYSKGRYQSMQLRDNKFCQHLWNAFSLKFGFGGYSHLPWVSGVVVWVLCSVLEVVVRLHLSLTSKARCPTVLHSFRVIPCHLLFVQHPFFRASLSSQVVLWVNVVPGQFAH